MSIKAHAPDVTAGPSFEEYEARYKRSNLEPMDIGVLRNTAAKIIGNRSTYEKVEKETGVPWWWVGCIHMRESSLSFRGWLANGDPLTAATVRVPAGLRGPGNPPWTWHDAAIVSLQHMNYHKENFSTLGRCLYLAEKYNGWGYITGAGRNTRPPSTSPYIWSMTDQYISGKYVADGRFDAGTVDQQPGVAAMMKALEEAGINLFPGKGGDVKKVTWVEFFDAPDADPRIGKNFVAGMNGADYVEGIYTGSTTKLIEVLQNWEATAKTFRVAPAGKQIPGTGPRPAPVPNPDPNPEPLPDPEPVRDVEPVIKLTKHPSGKRSDGLVQLIMEFFDNRGQKYGQVLCISGVPSAQAFRTGKDSRAGSLEPLPEGIYSVGNIEWAAGRDNYNGSWGAGLGPVWVGTDPTFATARSAIGIHRDAGAIGTAGCIGISSDADLRECVRLLRLHDPRKLIVDYRLGSLPVSDAVGSVSDFSPETENQSWQDWEEFIL